MRIPKSAARKRRLAVLRQIAPVDGAAPGDYSGPVSVEMPCADSDFVAACKAQLPLRLSVRNERTGETEDVLFDRPWVVIGGAENCDLRVLHPDISQRHTYLQFADGRLFVCDLASRTGTHWTTDSRPHVWLEPGEPLYLGPYSIRTYPNEFSADQFAGQTNSGSGPPSSECPPVAFTIANVVDRSGRPKLRRVRRTVTLAGASQVCSLRLQHASVGRVHSSFVWTPSGLWVVDLLCHGGTLVNGRLVNLALLSEGDEVAIGRFQLQVTYTPPAEDEAASSAPADSAGEMSVTAVSRPSDSSIAHPLAPPPIVFAAADEDSERGHSIAEPVAESVAANVAQMPAEGVAAASAAAEWTPVESAPVAAHFPVGEAASGLVEFRPPPLPLPVGRPLADAVAAALVQQFSSMQQDDFDRIQQMLVAMSQAFGAAHTRQLDQIRSALFRVHDVNRQLQELKLQCTISRQLPRESAIPRVRSESAVAFEDAPLREPRSGSPRSLHDEPRPPRPGRGLSDASAIDPTEPRTGGLVTGTNTRVSDRIRELEEDLDNHWQQIMLVLSPSSGDSR